MTLTSDTVSSNTVILADHSALLAIPAFAPAIVVVGVVVWIAMRDRRLGDDDENDGDDDGETRPASTSPKEGTP